MPARHRNTGIRKVCECPRRKWAKCHHAWHFSFTLRGESFRFSWDRTIGRVLRDGTGWTRDRASLGDPITTKTAAQAEAQRLRTGIRDGSLLRGPHAGPVLAT
jgi:hypothetical protein